MWVLGPVGKDARRKIMNLDGTNTSRSLTAGCLANPTMNCNLLCQIPSVHDAIDQIEFNLENCLRLGIESNRIEYITGTVF